MSTLKYILKKFNISYNDKIPMPIEIHNINRTIMAKTLRELGFKEGVEVGVAEGHHAKVLCDGNPGVRLHCVDIWEKYSGYEEYPDPKKCYRQARERLKPYNCVFIKKFSLDAVRNFADGSLDFAYIDSAHDFKSVAQDVSEWSKKVRVEGIVFGHDYKQHRSYLDKRGKLRPIIDVRTVVRAFCEAKNIHPLFELTNDIRDETFGLDNPGWCFVRQKGDFI